MTTQRLALPPRAPTFPLFDSASPTHRPAAPPQRSPTFPLYASAAPAPNPADALAGDGLAVDLDDPAARVGVGAAGVFYAGTFHGSNARVCLVDVGDDAPSEAVTRFVRSVREVVSVRDPTVQQVFGVVADDRGLLVVSEAFGGGWLRDVLVRNGGFGGPDGVRIAAMLARGLRELHERGIVHGDLSAGSVGVKAGGALDGGVCLADYGLSLPAAELGRAAAVAGGGGGGGWLTMSGGSAAAGAFQYFPPEAVGIVGGDRVAVGMAADVYALGVLLWEVRTGGRVWRGMGMGEVRDRVARGERPEWPASVGPRDVVRVVAEMCWCQDPVKRISAARACQMLEAAVAGASEGGEEGDGGKGEGVLCGQGKSVVQARIRQLQSNMAGEDGEDVFKTCHFDEPGVSPATPATPPAAGVVGAAAAQAATPDAGSTQPYLHSAMSPLTTDTEARHGGRAMSEDDVKLESSDNFTQALSATVLQSGGGAGEGASSSALPQSTAQHLPPAVYAPDSRGSPVFAASGSQRLFSGDLAPAAVVPVTYGARREDRPDPAETSPQHPALFAGVPRSGSFPSTNASISAMLQQTASSDGASRRVSRKIEMMGTAEWNDMLGVSQGTANSAVTGSAGTVVAPMVVSERTRERRRERRMRQLIEILVEENGLAVLQRSSQPPQRRRAAARAREADDAAADCVEQVRALSAAGDVTGVLQLMTEKKDSVSVARAGIEAVNGFAKDEDLFYAAVEEHAVDAVMAAVAHHDADEEICTWFCRTIVSLSEWYDDRIGHLIRAFGVPTVVVNVMEKHTSSKGVQIEGCWAMAAVCDTSEMNRTVCASLRGPFALHFAMSRNLAYWKDCELAKASLSAFRAIASDNEEAACALLNVCALDSVALSAKVFANADLEDMILEAMESVVFCERGRAEIIKAAGLHCMATIMVRKSDPSFLVRCCSVVTAVCRLRVPECEDEVQASGITENILVALRGTEKMDVLDAASVAFEATQTIAFIASFGMKLQVQCRLVGAIETVYQTLNARISNPRCVKMCVRAFFNLLKGNEDSILQGQRLGLIDALRRAEAKHSEIEAVQREIREVAQLLGVPEDESEPEPHARWFRFPKPSRASRPAEPRAVGKRDRRK